jgi:hypothetical protein
MVRRAIRFGIAFWMLFAIWMVIDAIAHGH